MVKKSSRGFLGGCVAAAATTVLCVSANANARTYEVANYALDRSNLDGRCSLREAVEASNTRRAVDVCPAGDASNDILITGDPATALEFSISEPIEIKSSILLHANAGPGFYQTIIGNNTSFVVRPGGLLRLHSLQFTGFNGTPFWVESGYVPGRGFVRGILTASRIDISGNTGPGTTFQTMSIANAGGEVWLNLAQIHHNDGAIKGGAVFNSSGLLSISNSAIYENTVSQYGGAIHNVGAGATASVSHSTLSGNSARLAGGAIFNGTGATVDLAWTTIIGNESEEKGGGIHAEAGGAVRVGTSIVSGSLGSRIDCSGIITSQGYNLLQNCPDTPSAVGDIRNVSANLGALTFRVGVPQWWHAPWHAPNFGSPVLNVVPNGTAGCLSSRLDQIYNPRLVGARCDIGAIERQ